MTNGGLLTTRSKRSPSTGSSRLPRRSSMSSPLSAALNRAKRSARSDRSVPTTVSQWVARCRLCTPLPTPRSRARRTARRMVHSARVVEALPMPRTCVLRQRAAGGDLGQVGGDPPAVRLVGVGAQVAGGAQVGALGAAKPHRTTPSARSVGRARSASSHATGKPSARSRMSTASCSARWRVARSAGRRCSRCNAAAATGPRASATPSTVNLAAARSARSGPSRAGSTRGVGVTTPSVCAFAPPGPGPASSSSGQ